MFLVFNQGIQSGMINHIASYIRPFHEWLAQVGLSTSRWVPCYRAIEHGWRSRAFHEGCQQDGPSIVLVRKKSFIFGGFSDISWNFEGRALPEEISFLGITSRQSGLSTANSCSCLYLLAMHKLLSVGKMRRGGYLPLFTDKVKSLNLLSGLTP